MRHRPVNALWVLGGALAVAAAACGAIFAAYLKGLISIGFGASAFLGLTGVIAAAAGARFITTSFRARGRQRTVMRLFGLGCVTWALGVLPYIGFVTSGGAVDAPAWWTQVGFLLAYVPWFRALWLLRRPIIVDNRRTLVDVIVVETGSFLMIGAGVAGILWSGRLTAVENVSQLLPAALDVLLVTAAYNVMRRASISVDSFYTWVVTAMCAMLVADSLTTYGVTRGPIVWLLPFSMMAYAVVFALMAVASSRQPGLRESSGAGERSTVAVTLFALAIAAPASHFTHPAVRWGLWVVAVLVAWRMFVMVLRQRVPDHDTLTGLFEIRALLRHGARMVKGATPTAPVAVVGVDLNEFSSWNAAHGFQAGDAVLKDLADRLVDLDMGSGVWGRVSSNRFSWIGPVRDARDARDKAGAILEAAAKNTAGLSARAGLAVCPVDATTPENARAAVQEALEAARETGCRLVAFDGGLLEGASTGAPSASFRARRERINEVITGPETLYPVYQPIVHMATLSIAGYEALSRIVSDPPRGPDQWITEAQRVGLGLEFEAECVRRALVGRPKLPAGAYMSVNASPDLVQSGRLDTLAPEGRLDWLVIEITEHEMVTDYAELGERLDNLRRMGARVAVDDLGAGHSTLRHVMRMSPEYAKLDRSLVEGIDRDAAKQALVRSMVTFARDVQCALVAEGVETLGEMATLRSLGMELGQGYLFQRPDARIVARLSDTVRHQVKAAAAVLPALTAAPGSSRRADAAAR